MLWKRTVSAGWNFAIFCSGALFDLEVPVVYISSDISLYRSEIQEWFFLGIALNWSYPYKKMHLSGATSGSDGLFLIKISNWF